MLGLQPAELLDAPVPEVPLDAPVPEVQVTTGKATAISPLTGTVVVGLAGELDGGDATAARDAAAKRDEPQPARTIGVAVSATRAHIRRVAGGGNRLVGGRITVQDVKP